MEEAEDDCLRYSLMIWKETKEVVAETLERWREAIEYVELKISRKKTEYLLFGGEDKYI